MFKQPVKFLRRFVAQKIGELKRGGESGGLGFLHRQRNGAGRKVETGRSETSPGKLADIMAGAAAGNTDGSARPGDGAPFSQSMSWV